MNCPYCATNNPNNARFCMACGHGLYNGLICHSCDHLLPPQARYCYHCGATLILPVGYQGAPALASTPAMAMPQPIAPLQTTPMAMPSMEASPASTAAEATIGSNGNNTVPATPALATVAKVPSTALILPPARPVQEMLPQLQNFLPRALYEPLERRPNERQLAQVRDHLTALLKTTKTYLPLMVSMSPQPAGEPLGGMYKGVFLFGDVSGFTPLSEQLKKLGQAGAEKITEIINSLFSELVGILYKYGGTLLKFGGDAILGIFPAENEGEMVKGALKAAQAALEMQECLKQEKFAAIQAMGETRALKIKCGISAGPYFAAHIGTKHIMAYVTTGHTVNEAEQAEGHAEPGDIVMTQRAYELVKDQIQVATVNREPDPTFFRLIGAPPVEEGFEVESIQEPPAGDMMQQITYLVDRMLRLSPYLNSELISRIVNNPGDAKMPPDHRPVTVMFINYVGISDLIQELGETKPDVITKQLNSYFVNMAQVVERYEGTVARMDQYAVGDRLVVFFGAPRAHEDDPVRAIYTALDMQKAVKKHFAALQTAGGIYRFRQRIGINTGHLFAGNVGAANLRQEYTLMGDDINMAARLMSKAGWQEIFISKKTQERVAEFFDLKDRGELKVKGKEILIPTFEVLGRRGEVGRKNRKNTQESPLVGRADAIKTLQTCAQRLVNGRGQIVSIVGDSGLGKSRLLGELADAVFAQEGGDKVHWLEGQALSFSEQMSYWLVAQILHSVLDMKPDSSEDDVLFSLWERGETLLGKETAREVVPFLAHIMNLELEGEWAKWVKELDPKVRQKQIFWAAREFFTAEARKRPTIIALDDLHWADEASLAVLETLMESSVQAPLMFCFVYRPLREKGVWRLRSKATGTFHHRYTEVMLDVLTKDQSIELLTQLLPGAIFDRKALQDILDKTAGNPFYIQEVVRSLVDSQAVIVDESGKWRVTEKIHEITVPDTLQGAIIARIDRLTEDARQALQMAAVIGRRFQMVVLSNLTKADQELTSWLAQLERSDLIHPADINSESAYLFLDALVQEVAYENLLVQRRQEFHSQVGEALEIILGDRLNDPNDELAIDLDGDGIPEQAIDLLAYHYGLSNNQEKAIRYLAEAGKKAQAKFASETALAHYQRLLELLAEAEAPWEQRYEVLSNRQQIYSLVGKQEARSSDLENMLILAQANQDERRRAEALNGMADLYQWTGRYQEAKESAQQALEINQTVGSEAGQADALHQLGVIAYVGGNFGEAKPLLEQAVQLRKSSINQEGEAWSTMYLGMIEFMTGSYGNANDYHNRALEMAENRHDAFQIGIHLTNIGRVALSLGEYQQALESFEKSLDMKQRVGDRVGQGFSLYNMGLIYTYLEHYDQAQIALQESLTLRRDINDERGVGYSLYGLGLVELGKHQYEAAGDFFKQAYDTHNKLNLQAEAIIDLSFFGQARLGAENLKEAQAASERAVTLLAEQKNPQDVAQIYFNHYRLLAHMGDASANEFLHKAYDAMMSQAERIQDPTDRQFFLDQVKVNQAIQAEMQSSVGVA